MKLLYASLLAGAVLAAPALVLAHDHSAPAASAPVAAAAAAPTWTPAEVTKIDAERGRITLAHGPIENLKMAGMTMPFNVKDRAFLTRVKVGDRVQFKADRIDGKYVVVDLRPAK